ncbi:CoA pyrophosphatase [Rubrivivax gelatinosus]|uniref:Putative hydrolase n=1 Tax=Rubrivivax gelatinosus (strain NBRC 100245 / IL144) TaxID=983917 RepID=I0HNV5_RUBGI|nr:CoA pyrophosphatase [Rubrivivax gelatinosus]BAL94692.1 putative hydrolase [Rubrivivax gelatinosus IL144]
MTPTRILHPQSIPVAGVDAHLPPVPLERLTPAALRRRFAAPGDWTPELAGDGRPTMDRPSAAAAVLVPIVDRGDAATVLLTRRTEHLRDHAGQISFPGGRVEPEDADAAATALREAEEEVGLARARIEVIGQLPTYTTVTHFVVTPVVAIVTPPFELTLDAFEVAAAFEVPLAFLMDPANHRRHVFEAAGASRQFLSMPWGEHFIWGATAAMLRNLYGFLAET